MAVLLSTRPPVRLEPGEQDWTGSLGIRGCLFCFLSDTVGDIEGWLEGRDYTVLVESGAGQDEVQ